MSRTIKGKKDPSLEFWSRRGGALYHGPVAKWKTKKLERTRNKRLERQALIDPESVEGRFPGE